MYLYQTLITSCRELMAQLLRSSRAARRYPHVYFAYNTAVTTDCSFGRSVRIYENTRIASTTIGDYSYVGGGSQLQNATVGKFCSIGPAVRIGLGLHPVDHVSTYPGFYSNRPPKAFRFANKGNVVEHVETNIGNDVWIGLGAIVMDGVRVGHGAVIGAGAVVTHDVAPYAIVAGVPARRLRDRFEPEMIAFLMDFAWWDRDDAFLRQYAPLFATPDQFRAALMAT